MAFGLCLASFASFQQFKLPPALPLMLAEYDYNRIIAGGFISVYAVAGLLLSMALGREIQRRGTTRPVALALILMTVAIAVTLAVPQSGEVVLVARGLEGVAFAILAIAGPVLANAHASARYLPIVIALTAAWMPIGQLAAVLLARPAFAVMGWAGLWWLALFLTVALLAWALARGRTRADTSAVRTPAPTASHSDASEVISKQKRVSLVLAGAIYMLWTGQYYAYMTWLPQYLVEAIGLSVEDALWGYAVPVAVQLASILVTGYLLKRGLRVELLLITGLALQALTWTLMPLADGGALGFAALVLYGVGAGLVPTCIFAMPSLIVGQAGAAASAFGIIMTGRNLGVLFGPMMLAQIFAVTGTWGLGTTLLGGVTAVALVLGLWLGLRLAGAAYGTIR